MAVEAEVPSPGRRHPAAVYRRRRVLVLMVASLLILLLTQLASSAFSSLAARSGPALVPAAGHSYVVQPGDTLWSIAHRFDPSGDERPLVQALADELKGTQPVPGQALTIP